MTARSFCFTINNWTEEDIFTIDKWDVRYVIYGKEVGKNGTRHLQGYVELAKPRKIGGLKELHPKAHWELRKGTRDQARNYCMKEGKYHELGDWDAGGQGKRTDLKSVVTKLLAGEKRADDIIIEEPELASQNLRWLEKVQQIADKKQSQKFREVKTLVLIGDAGSGKTSWVYEHNKYEDVFTVNPEDNFPFDGYNGETTILIDDFYGNLKYSHLLRILDGHPLRLNVKGGHRYALWNKIYITSNDGPESWYKMGLTDALKRRITKTTRFRNLKAG